MDLSLDKQDLEFRDEFEERLQSHPPTRRAHVAAHLLGDTTELRRELAIELSGAPAGATHG